jgi:hypothetical protein
MIRRVLQAEPSAAVARSRPDRLQYEDPQTMRLSLLKIPSEQNLSSKEHC